MKGLQWRHLIINRKQPLSQYWAWNCLNEERSALGLTELIPGQRKVTFDLTHWSTLPCSQALERIKQFHSLSLYPLSSTHIPKGCWCFQRRLPLPRRTHTERVDSHKLKLRVGMVELKTPSRREKGDFWGSGDYKGIILATIYLAHQ